MAVFTGVAKVPDARIRGVALARLDRDEPFAAAGKALELDGGKRVLRQQAAERQSKNDKSCLHIHTPIFSLQARFAGQHRLRKGAADCQFWLARESRCAPPTICGPPAVALADVEFAPGNGRIRRI